MVIVTDKRERLSTDELWSGDEDDLTRPPVSPADGFATRTPPPLANNDR